MVIIFFILQFIGIESVSKNTFLRQVPELHKYLTESLGAILLSAHNKVNSLLTLQRF